MSLQTLKYRGYTIDLDFDSNPENPRKEWDNFGKMVCWHRRYNLGDEMPNEDPKDYFFNLVPSKVIEAIDRRRYRFYCSPREAKMSGESRSRLYDRFDQLEAKAKTEWLQQNIAKLPLSLYDHSGITMSTGAPSCQWDSGYVGYIYVSLKDAQDNWMVKPEDRVKGWDFMIDDWDKHGKLDGKKISLRDVSLRLLEGEVEVYDNYLTGQIFEYGVLGPDGEDVHNCGGWHDEDEAMNDAKSSVDADIRHKQKKHAKQMQKWISNKVPLSKRTPCPV